MAGRYAFSLPEPQPRDGWFRLGNVDITTTVLVAGLCVISMFVVAIDEELALEGVFVSEWVREGEVWRLALWPLVNPPGLWPLLGVVIFWYFGRFVEDQVGRVPQAVLLAAMTVLPALVVTLVDVANSPAAGDITRWTVSSFSIDLLGLGMLCIFCAANPNAPFFFGIPAWLIATAILAMRILEIVALRSWGTLLLLALVVGVGIFGARQRGMADDLAFIPRFRFLAGGPVSPYGEHPSSRPKGRGARRGRGGGGRKGGRGGAGGTVVAGPWNPSTNGPTPLEHAELDSLLDIIAERGIDALTPQERKRLDELRRRMREG